MKRFSFIELVLLTTAMTLGAIVSAQPTLPVSAPKLVYTNYLGTNQYSYIYGLAVDSAGYVYAAGLNPTVGSGSVACAFLTKLNQAGNTVSSTCMPFAEVESVALDAAGYIYVVARNTDYTSAVMKLSPDAQQTLYSTQIDGYSASIAVDSAGAAYISGTSDSTFQATPGAYMSSGGQAFAIKLNPDGSINYAALLDLSSGRVAVDSKGQVWVAGSKSCPICDSTNGPPAAIRKLDATGTHLLVSNTFGGGHQQDDGPPYYDTASGIAVDSSDSVWVVGTTQSGAVPITPNALQPHFPFGNEITNDGWVLKLSSSGDLLYGTYVASNQAALGSGVLAVAVDGQDRPYFALNSPYGTAAPYCIGMQSASLMALSPDGSLELVDTPASFMVQAIALDGNGGLYVAGNASVAKYDLTTQAPISEVDSLLNAGAMAQSSVTIAPGEIVTMFGRNFPQNPTVTFNGTPAPILYADANQINAVVPFELGLGNAALVVGSIKCTAVVEPASPGFFTADGSGSGQVAALNQDGTVNSSANPASVGSVIAVYITGAGAMMPPIGDGQLGPLQPPYPMPVLALTAYLYDVNAPVLFVGQAPGLIAGAVQVNIRIPEGTPSGNVVLYLSGSYQIQFDGTTSTYPYRTMSAATTIAVQ